MEEDKPVVVGIVLLLPVNVLKVDIHFQQTVGVQELNTIETAENIIAVKVPTNVVQTKPHQVVAVVAVVLEALAEAVELVELAV